MTIPAFDRKTRIRHKNTVSVTSQRSRPLRSCDPTSECVLKVANGRCEDGYGTEWRDQGESALILIVLVLFRVGNMLRRHRRSYLEIPGCLR